MQRSPFFSKRHIVRYHYRSNQPLWIWEAICHRSELLNFLTQEIDVIYWKTNIRSRNPQQNKIIKRRFL